MAVGGVIVLVVIAVVGAILLSSRGSDRDDDAIGVSEVTVADGVTVDTGASTSPVDEATIDTSVVETPVSTMTLDPPQAVTVSGTRLPTKIEDEASADPAIGQSLPTLTGATTDGSAITIAPTGKRMLVVVLAHWCSHCQDLVPRIVDWSQSGEVPSDLDIVSIVSSNNPQRANYPASEWLARENWPFPVLIDDDQNRAGSALGLNKYTFWVLADEQGRVLWRGGGAKLEEVRIVVEDDPTLGS